MGTGGKPGSPRPPAPPHVTYRGLSSLKLTSQKSRDERLPVRAVKGTVLRAEQSDPETARRSRRRRREEEAEEEEEL